MAGGNSQPPGAGLGVRMRMPARRAGGVR